MVFTCYSSLPLLGLMINYLKCRWKYGIFYLIIRNFAV